MAENCVTFLCFGKLYHKGENLNNIAQETKFTELHDESLE